MKKSIIITYLFALLLTVSAIAQKERESISDKFGNQLSIQMNDKMGSAHRVYGNLPNISIFGFQRAELNQVTVRNLSSKFFLEYLWL